MREVLLERTELYLDDVTTDKGYAFEGVKGTFILAKDTNGKFIWVRLTPGKVGKPVNAYDDIKSAIRAKIEGGFTVYQFDDAELS